MEETKLKSLDELELMTSKQIRDYITGEAHDYVNELNNLFLDDLEDLISKEIGSEFFVLGQYDFEEDDYETVIKVLNNRNDELMYENLQYEELSDEDFDDFEDFDDSDIDCPEDDDEPESEETDSENPDEEFDNPDVEADRFKYLIKLETKNGNIHSLFLLEISIISDEVTFELLKVPSSKKANNEETHEKFRKLIFNEEFKKIFLNHLFSFAEFGYYNIIRDIYKEDINEYEFLENFELVPVLDVMRSKDIILFKNYFKAIEFLTKNKSSHEDLMNFMTANTFLFKIEDENTAIISNGDGVIAEATSDGKLRMLDPAFRFPKDIKNALKNIVSDSLNHYSFCKKTINAYIGRLHQIAKKRSLVENDAAGEKIKIPEGYSEQIYPELAEENTEKNENITVLVEKIDKYLEEHPEETHIQYTLSEAIKQLLDD